MPQINYTARPSRPWLVTPFEQWQNQQYVLAKANETVTLKRDIDQDWDPGGPYPYPWCPATEKLTLYPGEMSLNGGSKGIFSMVDETGAVLKL